MGCGFEGEWLNKWLSNEQAKMALGQLVTECDKLIASILCFCGFKKRLPKIFAG